jgi:hypothetical protein
MTLSVCLAAFVLREQLPGNSQLPAKAVGSGLESCFEERLNIFSLYLRTYSGEKSLTVSWFSAQCARISNMAGVKICSLRDLRPASIFLIRWTKRASCLAFLISASNLSS